MLSWMKARYVAILMGVYLLTVVFLLGVGLGMYLSPSAEDYQVPTDSPDIEFIHPMHAGCELVVNGQNIYLCKSSSGLYYYVKITHATLMQDKLGNPLVQENPYEK